MGRVVTQLVLPEQEILACPEVRKHFFIELFRLSIPVPRRRIGSRRYKVLGIRLVEAQRRFASEMEARGKTDLGDIVSIHLADNVVDIHCLPVG